MDEPKLKRKVSIMDKSIKEQRKILIIVSFFVVTLFFGSSYALLTNFNKSSEIINVTTANMNMSMTNTSGLINLTGKLPETDESGLANATAVPITLENVTEGPFTDTASKVFVNTSPSTMLIEKYQLILQQDASQTSTLSDGCVKFAISEDGGTTYKLSQNLEDANNVIYTGYKLALNATKTIYVKVWIDGDARDDGVDKTYYGSVKLELSQVNVKGLPKSSTMAYIAKNDTIKLDNIQFYNINGNNNGNGLYVLNGTENDTYPIYYYRGNVNNNNVYFAESCWKIVRTTETGGLKLVYNGAATTVNGEKQCNQTTGTGTQLSVGDVAFNNSYKNPEYAGYSIPESSKIYSYSSQSLNGTTYYGSSVDPTTNKLVDPVLGLDDTHHYSYNSTDINATGISGDTGNVRYYYNKSSASNTSGTGYYIKFDKTKTIGAILNEMLSESNSKDNPSTIQTAINTWWGTGGANSLDTKYGSYLEDTEWCNDRSVYSYGGWAPDGTLYSSNSYDWYLIFNEDVRYDQVNFASNLNNIKSTNTPILTCSNPNDRLTVAKGNLTHPIGLLTLAEVIMAGARWANGNTNFYLYTNQNYWLMSPVNFNNDNAHVGSFRSYGNIFDDYVGATSGVRPALSIKNGTEIIKGDGTATRPYIITED